MGFGGDPGNSNDRGDRGGDSGSGGVSKWDQWLRGLAGKTPAKTSAPKPKAKTKTPAPTPVAAPTPAPAPTPIGTALKGAINRSSGDTGTAALNQGAVSRAAKVGTPIGKLVSSVDGSRPRSTLGGIVKKSGSLTSNKVVDTSGL